MALRRSVRLASTSAAALCSSLPRCACYRRMSTNNKAAHSDEVATTRLVDIQEELQARLQTIKFFNDPRLLGAIAGLLSFLGMCLAGGVFLHGPRYITDTLSMGSIHDIQEGVGRQVHQIENSAINAYKEAETKVKEAVHHYTEK